MPDKTFRLLFWSHFIIFSSSVDWSSGEKNSPRNNTRVFFNSSDLSGAPARVLITICSVASLLRQIMTMYSDSNESTMTYGYRRKQPIIPRASTIWTGLSTFSTWWRPFCGAHQAETITPSHNGWLPDGAQTVWRFYITTSMRGRLLQKLGHFTLLNPGVSLLHQAHHGCRRPQNYKSRNWAKERFFRSTPAKPAVEPYQQRRHPNAQSKLRFSDFHSNFKSKPFIHNYNYRIYILICIPSGTFY